MMLCDRSLWQGIMLLPTIVSPFLLNVSRERLFIYNTIPSVSHTVTAHWISSAQSKI